MRDRKPSATNSKTLCGRDAGAWAEATDAGTAVMIAERIRSGKRINELPVAAKPLFEQVRLLNATL
jgi:hypothetical protein